MNLKTTEDFYNDVFEGKTIPSEVFEKYINDAYLKVMNKISKNLYDLEEDESEIIEKIKKCQCELAEFNFKFGVDRETNNKNNETGEVKSESAGSTSRTYVTSLDVYNERNKLIASSPENFENEIIRKYLGYTGLLYGGLK